MAKYFTDKEFVCPCCEELPTYGMDEALLEILDNVRAAVGQPLTVTSGYRCESHNAEVGGVPNSYHMQGCAADINVPDNLTPDELASIAVENGADGVGTYQSDRFVHIDTRGYQARWEER